VAVTVFSPDRGSTVLQGVVVNVSLEGARVRLPMVLPEGSSVSIALGPGDLRLGIVCWTVAQGESEVLHGVRFQVPMERGEAPSRPLRRLQRRQFLRRGLILLIGLAAIAVAAYGLNWWIDQLRTYYPKYYEPKDFERQEYEERQRLQGEQGTSRP
jgi:hypothetical protein